MNVDNMHTVCQVNMCNGCMACQEVCHKGAISIVDHIHSFDAMIDDSLCVHCGQCENVCPNHHAPVFSEPMFWKQGWAADENVRMASSSGGIAAALSLAFVQNGGMVCSCAFRDGEFRFNIAETEDEVKQFAGSKYVKSNPVGIYKKIKQAIKQEKRVLFIGLPCQAAAVKNFVGEMSLLYTVDLICHGSPSPKLLEMFLKERGLDIKGLKDLKFRDKVRFHLSNGYKGVVAPTVKDRYTHAFLSAVCYTENCYSCPYASTARVSDITLGDSWGSTLQKAEQDKGISLILCQTDKGQALLTMAKLHLEDVDVANAIAHNRQLNAPSCKPKTYQTFYEELKRKKHFNRAVKKSYPKFCFRQNVKAILVRMKIRGGGNS